MKKEILIAIFAAITLALSIWGYKFISGKNMFSGNSTYYAYYDNVQDVNTATLVQINGYEVGTVISIDPDPQDTRRIRLGFTVKKSIQLPDYTVAELIPISPLGGKAIELRFDKMCSGDNCAANKSVLEGRTVGILGSMINKEELESTMDILSVVIDSTLDQLGDSTSRAAVDVGIRSLSQSLENFAQLTDQMNQTMSRSSRNIEQTMSNLATLTGTLAKSNDKIESMITDLAALTGDLKSVKLSETVELTNKTLTQSESSLKSMETTMAEATASLDELTGILEKISKGEGAVGKLLNEEELYNNLNSTSRNIDLLIQDIRLNPRRYFRLFGKKSKEYEYPENDPADLDEGK